AALIVVAASERRHYLCRDGPHRPRAVPGRAFRTRPWSFGLLSARPAGPGRPSHASPVPDRSAHPHPHDVARAGRPRPLRSPDHPELAHRGGVGGLSDSRGAGSVSVSSAAPSMGRTAAAGAFHIGVSQGLRVVLTIGSTVIVARILAPADYGIMAMVAPITSFLLLFQNLGLSHAAVQAQTLSSEQSTALFWVNMTASAAIAALLLALAPVVGWFYGEPRAAYITAASAANVLVGGSTIQHLALFNRELRFRTLSRVDIGASATTFVATIVAAIALRSYWALWLGSFLGFVVNAALVWKHSAGRPSLRVSFAESRSLIRFGASITGFNLLNFVARNADNVLIGRVWGTAALGLYDRSYRL